MKKTLKIIIPVLIVTALVGFGIYSHISSKIPSNPENYAGNTSGNLGNGGKFCESDGKIFFSNPSDMGKLYSMNSDCTDIKKISEDCASYINAAGKYIYYVRDNSKGGGEGINVLFRKALYGITRCRTDGSKSRALTSGYCTDMTLSGNTIIYKGKLQKATGTCSMNTDGSDKKLVSDKIITNSCIDSKKIYYSSSGSDDHFVHALDIDTGNESLFMEGNTYMAQTVDGYLYYIDLDNGYALTRVNLADQKKEVISDDKCIFYNVYGNVVYYQAENGDDHGCYRINIDGSDRTEIMSGDISSISCTSQYTFLEIFNSQIIMKTPTFGHPDVSTFILNN